MTDKMHLSWIYLRMLVMHSENRNSDFMVRFHEIIDAMPNEDEPRLRDPFRQGPVYVAEERVRQIIQEYGTPYEPTGPELILQPFDVFPVCIRGLP